MKICTYVNEYTVQAVVFDIKVVVSQVNVSHILCALSIDCILISLAFQGSMNKIRKWIGLML